MNLLEALRWVDENTVPDIDEPELLFVRHGITDVPDDVLVHFKRHTFICEPETGVSND